MADYKIDFEINDDKTYCEVTKKTVIYFGMPLMFWLFLLPQILIWAISSFDWIDLLIFMAIEVKTVRYCVKQNITLLHLPSFLFRKRIQYYRPRPRRKSHTRVRLSTYFDDKF
ncbi:hypothetical protein ACNO5E_18750 [Vibrio parahaemolyticus]|uniref:hypothetical protein n=1 Tax=Vibrio parahaemolyticus TaxID=670 RepID=UPI000813AB3A|nr:hypothetical protein [Vibrio parahaemolyticus]OCP68300.1 hypothetical protein AKH08_15910 [Vibrio parahaemolyticus]